MNIDLKVENSIEINSNLNKVWEALTNPEKIKLYMCGTDTISDWKIGSPIIFQGEFNGQKYKDKGIIKNIVYGQLLQYTYWSSVSGLEDKPDNYSLVTYKLNFSNNVTKLSLSQVGFTNPDSQLHSENAWTKVLQNIKEIVEKG